MAPELPRTRVLFPTCEGRADKLHCEFCFPCRCASVLLVFFPGLSGSITHRSLSRIWKHSSKRISANRAANDRAVRLSTECSKERPANWSKWWLSWTKPYPRPRSFSFPPPPGRTAARPPGPSNCLLFLPDSPFREGRGARAVTKYRITLQGTVSRRLIGRRRRGDQ